MYAQPNWLTGTEMVVDVSEESIDLHIFKDELIIFTRTMPIDRSQYYRTFTSPVSEDNFEATSLVLETTLSFQEVDFEDVAATTDAAKGVSGGTTDITNLSYDEASYLSDLVNEIERAQNFFRYSLDQRDSEFKRIIITGEGTERVFSELKERMNTEVCRIDYSAIIPPDFNQLELLDTCSVAIGLAMRANEKNERTKKK
ncbi:hypothetical protein H1D32_06915 [Anaerobacillus sp. CMMVII]|uniref:hypothetical protein n=1 Tax=Anaerobacillus sp. CMMVII TaxID=2755588 RepID=UPI0021B842BD|nr:hypothetical protein [Anaerobacillus sp. CMMVII]MCT8137496.1 hypothetical protein [Anaerobacillus sp. CMMVII]